MRRVFRELGEPFEETGAFFVEMRVHHSVGDQASRMESRLELEDGLALWLRRGASRMGHRQCGGMTDVLEDLPDDARLSNGGNEIQASRTSRAEEPIDTEASEEKVGPSI
jgi:hypothetical protein